jgi:hypothetical protein
MSEAAIDRLRHEIEYRQASVRAGVARERFAAALARGHAPAHAPLMGVRGRGWLTWLDRARPRRAWRRATS